MKTYYVYILSNLHNRPLYVGVTNNLERRLYEHKRGIIEGYTKKYQLNRLLYYEETNDVKTALQREKQLKNWKRQWKLNLIRESNPDMVGLSEELFSWLKEDSGFPKTGTNASPE